MRRYNPVSPSKMAIGSKIELGRIVLYVFFPVAVFAFFNMPESYEEFMSQKKSGIVPCNRPPTTLEDIKKAREKMVEDNRKETAQQSQ
ncbi:unnamed protein product [Porites evermanni]|uniref:Uncharacterized protein n=1 Tax=Porites evermanni TaxID=104178 RepID=A0ABN8SMA4_9CNID|nr:unnamed protein product [Porites evermanni]